MKRLVPLGFRIILIAAALAVASLPATALPVRRLFEPTDLSLVGPGMAGFDTQVGLVRGSDTYRVAVPDLEINLGVLPDLELDLDTACNLEDGSGRFSVDRVNFDNLWLSGKTAIGGILEDEEGWTLGLGLQAGPKLPTARQAHEVGGEGLLLGSFKKGGFTTVINVGGLIDPRIADAGRPKAVQGGLTFEQTLAADSPWSIELDLAGVHFLSPDKDQFNATLVLNYQPSELLQFSISLLGGFTPGSDQFGILFGVVPSFCLWC